MHRLFPLLIRLYPTPFRAEFEPEMHTVFRSALADAASLSPRQRTRRVTQELLALLLGAVREQTPRSTPALLGITVAFPLHAALFAILVPIRMLLLGCLLLGPLAAQRPALQDPALLQTAKSLYAATLTAIRDAHTLDDMKKLADQFDSPDWVSIDRFGRKAFTRRQADTGLASLLALPAHRRITGLEILWAERDADRMIVLGWMMPNQAGRLTRATLFRDIFTHTSAGWRRIQHEKLLPNDFTLTVDGAPQIIPPLAESHRVAPATPKEP